VRRYTSRIGQSQMAIWLSTLVAGSVSTQIASRLLVNSAITN